MTAAEETGGRSLPTDLLEATLGHRFRDPDLLARALTHASAAGAEVGTSNERLEFLGDRVLGLAVARLVYARFPSEAEGALARRHAALVRRETLAQVAEAIGLGDLVRMSRGEEEAGGRRNPGLLADVCEAVLAALFLDGGLEVAEAFVNRMWQPLMYEDAKPPEDAKTALQEWAQGRGLPLPRYREISRVGPSHAPLFSVRVEVEGLAPVAATGRSKRAAEKAAARELLDRIRQQSGA
jgi:ribonuclease-3